MKTFKEICDSIRDIDLMFDDELMSNFMIDIKENGLISSSITDLLKAGGLREDDICELSLKDMKNIIEYVNHRYDLNLAYVNHKLECTISTWLM